MSTIALALVLTAAVLHTTWNLLVKQAKQKLIFTWLALLAGTLCFLPVLFFSAPLPPRAWIYALAGAAAEAVYYLALARAYEQGDFSLVYPIARGAAPALLLLWSVLFLGEHLQPGGIIGVLIILLGLLVIGGATLLTQRGNKRIGSSGIAAALLVALCISIYSAIDGAAVQFAPPLAYTIAVLSLTAVLTTPIILKRYGVQPTIAEWRANRGRILLVGVLTTVTYILVLVAYSYGQVGYAGAVREVSIVLAAFVGWRWLGEGFGAPRLIGAILIFFGILVIAVAG